MLLKRLTKEVVPRRSKIPVLWSNTVTCPPDVARSSTFTSSLLLFSWRAFQRCPTQWSPCAEQRHGPARPSTPTPVLSWALLQAESPLHNDHVSSHSVRTTPKSSTTHPLTRHHTDLEPAGGHFSCRTDWADVTGIVTTFFSSCSRCSSSLSTSPPLFFCRDWASHMLSTNPSTPWREMLVLLVWKTTVHVVKSWPDESHQLGARHDRGQRPPLRLPLKNFPLESPDHYQDRGAMSPRVCMLVSSSRVGCVLQEILLHRGRHFQRICAWMKRDVLTPNGCVSEWTLTRPNSAPALSNASIHIQFKSDFL